MMYSQTRNGKTRFFESYIDPRNNMRRVVSVTLDRDTKQSRKQAQNILNARISELKGNTDNVRHMALKDLCAAYIAAQRATFTPQTVIGNERALNAIMLLLGEDTDINVIDARMVFEKLDKSGDSPTRKNYRLKHLKKLFRWAYKMDYVSNIKFIDKLGKYKDDERGRREHKYLEPEELTAVLNAMKVEKHRLLTEFLALTGMRIGEALAMTADDIDIERRTITINKTLSLVTYEIGRAKTDDSNRVIRIQTELLPLINKILPGCFTSVQYYTYNKYLKETTGRVIGRSLSAHALRHTHTSLLAAAGVPLDVISRRLGHADSDVTREIYLHVTKKMVDMDAAILDNVRLLKPTKNLPK